jgi:predicted RNase H-like HicB family nuclease
MTVLVPMTVEQDEDGWWCAHARLGPNVGANGQGRTRKEALDDLREAVLASFEADGGIPEWLVRSDLLAVDVARLPDASAAGPVRLACRPRSGEGRL